MNDGEMVDRQTYDSMEYLACMLASCIMESEEWCEEELEAEMRWEILSNIQINEDLENVVRRLAELVDNRYPFLKVREIE